MRPAPSSERMERSTSGRLATAFAAVLIAALIVLSWLPRDYADMLRPGWASQLDHLLAYAVAALVAAAARPLAGGPALWSVFAVLAGVLEVGQIFMPGRTPQVSDFVASIFGAGWGVWLGLGLARRRADAGFDRVCAGMFWTAFFAGGVLLAYGGVMLVVVVFQAVL
jgi:hypothetical protein